MRRRDAMQQWLEQRIVSAPEHKSIRIAESVGKGLIQVDAGDLFGDGVLDPPFFDQRHQQRTSFLARIEAPSLKRLEISVAADRSLGPEDTDFPVLADGSRRLSARLNDAHYRNVGRSRDAFKSQRRSRVASDDQQLGSMGFQVMGSLHRITSHGFHRLGTIREPGGIAKVY